MKNNVIWAITVLKTIIILYLMAPTLPLWGHWVGFCWLVAELTILMAAFTREQSGRRGASYRGR